MILMAQRRPYDEHRHLVLFQKLNLEYGLDLLIEKVKTGTFLIYEVTADNVFVGIFTAKLDRLIDNTPELVILHAAAVADIERPMTSILNPLFESVARENGIKSIRVHSDKKGLDKILEDNNFKFTECIYRKVL